MTRLSTASTNSNRGRIPETTDLRIMMRNWKTTVKLNNSLDRLAVIQSTPCAYYLAAMQTNLAVYPPSGFLGRPACQHAARARRSRCHRTGSWLLCGSAWPSSSRRRLQEVGSHLRTAEAVLAAGGPRPGMHISAQNTRHCPQCQPQLEASTILMAWVVKINTVYLSTIMYARKPHTGSSTGNVLPQKFLPRRDHDLTKDEHNVIYVLTYRPDIPSVNDRASLPPSSWGRSSDQRPWPLGRQGTWPAR